MLKETLIAPKEFDEFWRDLDGNIDKEHMRDILRAIYVWNKLSCEYAAGLINELERMDGNE